MAGLQDYPVIMNGTTVPFMPSLKNKPKINQKVNKSEGGRDIVQIFRKNQMSTSVSLKLADFHWVQFFYQLYMMDSFVMKQFNPLVGGYDERTVRIDDFDYDNEKDSDKLTAVVGVWNVNFTIEEF
jgi:hypothetical protein